MHKMASNKARAVINSTKPKPFLSASNETALGSAGYDNARDDIEAVKKMREGSCEKVPIFNNDIVNKSYCDGNVPTDYWITDTDQTLLTGDKSGSFDLTTTGTLIIDKITPPTASDLVIKLGDAAGARELSIKDSGNAKVASIDSDGRIDGTTIVSSGGVYANSILNVGAGYVNIKGSTPSIVQTIYRLGQAGFAFDMFDLKGQNSIGTSQLSKIGLYGSVTEGGGLAPVPIYLFIDAKATAAYNNAFIKIDTTDRMALGLSSSTRPTTAMLEVYGDVYNTGTITSTTGGIIFPSADPGIAGAWWDNAGTLTRSAG